MRITIAAALLVVACGSPAVDDAGTVDSGAPPDAGVADSGALDDGGLDAGPPDAGAPDAGRARPQWLLPPSGITASQLGVVVNTNDPLSVAVADRYMQARGIPAEHRIDVSFPVGAVMSVADFTTAKALVDARLDGGIQALALTWTSPYRVTCMSVTAAFAMGFDAGHCSTQGAPCAPTALVPTFDSRSHRLWDDFRILPTMMLAAADAGDAFALISRGVAADGTSPGGDAWFVRTTDAARSVRWPDFIATVNQLSDGGSVSARYVDDAGAITGQSNVLFYLTGLASVPGIATNTYRPGAVCDHLTSFGGQVPNSGQMSALRWLEAGCTASFGTVVEPCNFTSKFPQASVLLRHYFRGEPIVEAYWKSVYMPGEGLFIGEPLARPFDADVVGWDEATATFTLSTNRLEAARTYSVEGAFDAGGPWTQVQTGIRIPTQRRVVIAVQPADFALYRLVP